MNNIDNNISQKICNLIKKQCVFLVGAGVSMQAPSSLPSGIAIKDLIINWLSPVKEKQSILKKLNNLKTYNDIVPEIIFQRAYEVIEDKLFPFFHILENTGSNYFHFLLAEFVKKYKCSIFTTNFDELIEKHLLKKNEIIHLHGQLSDSSNMIIRINQVGKGLSYNLQKQFKKTTNGKSLIVLGYSGNDKDIMDLLNSSSIKNIFWFVLNKNNEQLKKNLKLIKKQKTLTVIEKDINFLCSDFKKILKIDNKINNSIKLKFNQYIYLKQWASKITNSEKYSFIQKIFFDLENYKYSIKLIDIAIKKKYFDNIRTKSWFYNEKAWALRQDGNLKSGIYFINKAIEYKSNNYYVTANTYNIKGILLLESFVPKPKESLILFEKAMFNLKMFNSQDKLKWWEEEKIVFLSRILNNMGLAYTTLSDFSLAIKYYKDSLKLKRKIGNLDGICITATNICIVYLRLNKKYSYYYWKKKIFLLFHKYNFSFTQAYFYRECGRYFLSKGKIKKGLKYLNISKTIYLNSNNKHGLKIVNILIKQFKKD